MTADDGKFWELVQEERLASVARLDRPPIDLRWAREKIEGEYAERLQALLDEHGLDADLQGWRELAINLAIEFHPAFKVKARQKLPVSGRPIKSLRWFWRQQVLSRAKKVMASRQAKGHKLRGARAQAAKEVHEELVRAELRAIVLAQRSGKSVHIPDPPDEKTLQNLISEPVPFPLELRQHDHMYEARAAAQRAAQRLKSPP
jgi:hypothetical protein